MRALIRLRQARPWKQNLLPKNAVLIHASSGEIEYAKPVVHKLRELLPDQKIILTYFSPSTLKLVKNLEVDALVPLPWDSTREVRQFLDHLEPRALWISRTDLWPELLHQCRQRKIPTLLFSASFAKPRGILSRTLRRWNLDQLSEISFISPQDLDRFKNFSSTTAFCDGNTRVDQVIARLSEMRKLPLERYNRKPAVILGSLWPADIKVWLQVLQSSEVADKFQWIWVPHEIDATEILNLQKSLEKISNSVEVWTETRISKADHLIVNTVGFLAEIYQMGQVAFVGGSFDAKVHSLLEPFAAGLPVMVGPYYKNQPEAEAFAHLELPNGIRAVTAFDSGEEIQNWLKNLKVENHSQIILERLYQDKGATQRLIQRHLAAPALFSSTPL